MASTTAIAEMDGIVRLLTGKYALMNLIPYNATAALDYRRPAVESSHRPDALSARPRHPHHGAQFGWTGCRWRLRPVARPQPGANRLPSAKNHPARSR